MKKFIKDFAKFNQRVFRKINENSIDLDNYLLDVKDLFEEIVDLKNDYFQIRGADDQRYQKVFDVDFSLTKAGNILVKVHCDWHWSDVINREIKSDIFPRLISTGFKPISIKNEKTSQWVQYKVPVSGSDSKLVWVSDRTDKIIVTIKILNQE